MKVYDSGKIRNVGIVAHGGAGKTSLTEALLFNVGAITRLGKVDDGNTTTDYLPEEIKRKLTINTAMAPIEWRDCKINFLDTPGYADFIADVKGTLRVVDSLIFTVCAVSGVEVQTDIIWNYADQANLPRLVFINKMDRENANFYNVLDQLNQVFSGKHIVPVFLPIGAENTFEGVIDVLTMKALKFDGSAGKYTEMDIPANYADDASTYRMSLIEAAAEGDDEILMKYLDGEELSLEEIKTGLKAGIKEGKVVPVLCGSALKNIGITPILDVVYEYLPSPLDRSSTDKDLCGAPLGALIFKTVADPYVGKISFLRIFEGVLKADSTVYNANKESEEKISQLFIMTGKNQQSVTELRSGDIGAVTKLQVTTTGDTLTVKNNPCLLEGIDFPVPTLTVAIQPKSKGDEDKLGNAISRLLEEDTTLRLEKNVETKETLLTGMGEMHIDIILERLQRKFGVEVTMSNPKVPYRETIKSAVTKIEGKHKKQSGGHGQYGHVFIDLAPSASDFEFEETIFGGSVPKQYIPAVEKGIREAMNEGILAGYPVTNFKVTLTDGSYHPVDSSEMAFKIAAALAFRKALEKAKPVLLEPYMQVEVTVPEQFMGDIIGDFNSKRGRILGMEPHNKMQVIHAVAPLSEMYRYAIDLKAITQGRGSFTMSFAQYEEVPQNIAEKIIEAAKVEKSS